ncbi:MAG: hypothetical protein PHY73_05800 [Candidatus Omnitrophica bacterium]|nr:hypothetical protein [Candidatus Omnitrophota bacterium]
MKKISASLEKYFNRTIAFFVNRHPLVQGVFTLGLIVSCLYFAYSPALRLGYIHHDDILFFLNHWTYKAYGCFSFNFSSGRFVGAFILEYATLIVNTVAQLTLLRYFTFFILSMCALFLVRWYHRRLLSFQESLFFVLIVFTLPYFEIVVSYAGIFFHAIALFISIGSGFLAYQSAQKVFSSKILKYAWIFFSVFLFVLALSIYQSVAVFYWALLGPVILFSKKENFARVKRQIIFYYGIGMTSMVFYAGLLQIAKQFLLASAQKGYNPYDMSFSLWQKLIWFAQEPLVNSLNLWNVYPSVAIAIGVLIIIVGSLSYFGFVFFRDLKEEGFFGKEIFVHFAWRVGAFVPLFFLSFLPNLLWPGKAPFYRCCLGPVFLIMCLLFWSFKQWMGVFSLPRKKVLAGSILLLIVLMGTFLSQRNIYQFIAYPNHVEFEFFKKQLASKNLDRDQQIYLVHPGSGVLKERYDEFGFQTSNAPQDRFGFFVGALRDVLRKEYFFIGIKFDFEKDRFLCAIGDEQKRNPFVLSLDIQSRTLKDMEKFPENSLVVDTTTLYGPGGPLEYLKASPETSGLQDDLSRKEP